MRRYLREKDHFERQYKKHLSKRLLANKPPAEGGLIVWAWGVCVCVLRVYGCCCSAKGMRVLHVGLVPV